MRKFKKVKNFDGKKIIIRPLLGSDVRNAKKFQDFFNSLVEDRAEIRMDKKKTLKEEMGWLKERLKETKRKEAIYLIAEYNNIVIGATDLKSHKGRGDHVAELGIMIKNGYRGIGLGSFMINEAIKLAKKELKFKLKIIRLSVTSTNKRAFKFYIKNGFKKVSVIPDQLEVKKKFIDEIIMLKYL